MSDAEGAGLQSRCELLRSLHVPGDPLLLPNAWDAITARSVVKAGYPVVATTSGGVAASLGYDDQEGAPPDEMLAAATRIARSVEVPVTVDAEAGYGMTPADLVASLRGAGAAGCNVEDTDHATGEVREMDVHSSWLRSLRLAAEAVDYPLVVNARIDVFFGPFLAGADPSTQVGLVPEAVERANRYFDAGADCVYPIGLWEPGAIEGFVDGADGPVNVTRLPQSGPVAELAALGVARVSWAIFLYLDAMAHFEEHLERLQG